jgi:Putative glutamine amidotransferase
LRVNCKSVDSVRQPEQSDMSNAILYLGDTHLHNAAAYLAGLMHAWGWPFDYRPGDVPLGEADVAESRSLYIVSDYPAANIAEPLQRRIVDDVFGGAGLLMIGGWESFHGLGGHWDGTPIGNALPVEIASTDDRVNCDRPLLVARVRDHPAIDGLPWDARPPVIGGFNRVRAKPEADVVLETRMFAVRCEANTFHFEAAGADPLLVFGRHGKGRTAALATDVAPHWVGPLVDWGDGRVTARATAAGEVEVGDLYVGLLQRLLAFLKRG